MRLVDRVRASLREFVLGDAAYAPGAEHYGIAPSEFSPEEYGNYIATSNAVYTCATMRAKYLSSLPLRLYKLQRNGERLEVTSGPLWELVNKINDFWTFSRWVEMTELSLCLWGSSYTFLERGQTGKLPPREMWWGRPDRVFVYPDPVNYIKGFGYEPMTGQQPIAFTPGETFWLHYPNPLNEYAGLSPLAAARISADFGTSAMRANDKIFRNGMQLSGAIFPPEKGSFSPEQARDLEGLLEKRFQGVDKAHRWAVFRHPMAMQQLGWSPKDAEMLGGLKWSLEDVCRAYHWPIDLVGGQRTYENLDAAMRAAWTNCIIPEAVFIANEFTEQVLPMFPGTADVAVFDTTGIAVLQENRGELVAQIATLAAQGVPLNRLLQEFMPQLLPPNEQGYAWGDVWWAQSTLVPVENAEPRPALAPVVVAPPAEEPGEEEPAEEEPVEEPAEQAHGPAKQRGIEYGSIEHQRADKAFQDQIAPWERKIAEMTRDLFTRLQASVQDRLTQRAARNVEDVVKAPFERAKWTKIFRVVFRDLLIELIGDVMESAAVDLGVSFSPDMADPNVVRFLENRSQRFAEEVLETTWVQLKESLSEGVQAGEGIPKLAERVDTVMDSRKSSAETIARTEVVGANNGGTLIAWKQSGVVESKEWLTALDGRERDTHRAAHGQQVGIDEDFSVGEGSGPAPGQIGLAEEDINCFVPDTTVQGAFVSGLKANYAGPVWEIETRRGYRLTVTPNHPILTDQGWIAAHELRKGVNLFSYSKDVRIGVLDDKDDQDGPVRIADVFDALAANRGVDPAMLVGLDLHGDATLTDGQVEIIRANGILPGNSHSISSIENVHDVQLVPPVAPRMMVEADGAPDLGFLAISSRAAGIPASAQLALDKRPVRSHALPLEPFCVGAPADWHTMHAEKSREGGAAMTAFFGQLLEASSGQIALDEIVGIRELSWCGHVYDLQSCDGWIIAQNIVTSNCRCSLRPVVKQ